MGFGYCKRHYRSFKKYGDPLIGYGHGTHLLSRTSEYQAWSNMKSRCYNPNFSKYEFYGGRGITVYEKWRDDFQAFIDHIGLKPSPKHSLDRKDSNGNYEPGNVRWTTQSIQGINQRLRNTNKSGYRGVSFQHKKWAAQITINNVGIHLGRFDTKLEAAIAYNNAAIKYHGKEAKLNDIPN